MDHYHRLLAGWGQKMLISGLWDHFVSCLHPQHSYLYHPVVLQFQIKTFLLSCLSITKRKKQKNKKLSVYSLQVSLSERVYHFHINFAANSNKLKTKEICEKLKYKMIYSCLNFLSDDW